MSKTPVLTKKDLIKAGRRWYIGISTFNYETQLAPSVVYAVYPLLRKMYPDDEDLKKSVLNQTKYFNTHPWIANFVLGAAMAMEDENGLDSLEAVQDLKVGLMGPLAGIGDTIIWAMIPTIFGSIAASLAQNGSPLGAFLWLLLYGSSLLIRPKLMWIGYQQGTKLISQLGNRLSYFTDAISVLGLTVVGSILSSTIKLSTGFVYKNEGVTLKIQDTLDTILPSLLPVILVGVLYYLMGVRKMKMTTIILIVIIFALVGSFFGILAV